MQIVQSKNNIVEKVLLDKEGRLVRARFVVYENGGRIKAKLIDFVYITAGFVSGKVLSLSTNFKKVVSQSKTFLNKTVVSPFLNLNSIYSSGSKPRAPTFI